MGDAKSDSVVQRVMRFYWNDFLTDFCYHLPLPLTLLAIFGMVAGEVGGGLGLPLLVWNQTRPKGLAVAFALAFVWIECLLVGYLVRRRKGEQAVKGFFRYGLDVSLCFVVTAAILGGASGLVGLGALGGERGMGPIGWLIVFLGPTLAFGVALAVRQTLKADWAVAREARRLTAVALASLGGPAKAPYVRLLFLALGGLLYVGWALMVWLDYGRVPHLVNLVVGLLIMILFLTLFVWSSPTDGEDGQGAADPADHATAIGYLLVGGAVLLVLSHWETTASPVVIGAAFWLVVLAIYGFLAAFVHRFLPAALLLLAVMLFIGGLPAYKYRIPGLEAYYDDPPKLQQLIHATTAAERERLLPDIRLPSADEKSDAVWKRLRRPNAHSTDEFTFRARNFPVPDDPRRRSYSAGEKRPLVVIAVSGGGIRAAAWALAVLQRLEHEFAADGIDFPAHVRVITGASGGMLGASYYVARLPQVDATETRKRDVVLGESFELLAGGDYLTPLARELIFRDVPCLLSPWPRPHDRGVGLEHAWDDRLGGKLGLTFDELRLKENPPEQPGSYSRPCPSLVFSPMLIEDGRRLLISNLDLRYVSSNDGNLLRTEYRDPTRPVETYSREAIELFKLFPDPEVRKRFRLGTAVRLSASFPYFSPGASLPTEPRYRVVDAGYYDNDGISVAASWLFSGMNRDWIEENASRVVLIQIRDSSSEESRLLGKFDSRPPNYLLRALEQLTTPPEGLWQMRIASSSFRNDGQLELLSQVLNGIDRERGLREGAAKAEPEFVADFRRAREAAMRNELAAAVELYRKALARLEDARKKWKAGPQHERFFNIVNYEFTQGDQVSLSWSLTPGERAKIEAAAGWPPARSGSKDSETTDAAVKALKGWWKARP